MHCATNTAESSSTDCVTNTSTSSSTALRYQNCCIINCIVLPTLLHRQQMHYATNTAASSSNVLCYRHCCIVNKCTMLPTLLHPHQLHCATNTAKSSPAILHSTAHYWYQYRYCTSTEPRETWKFLRLTFLIKMWWLMNLTLIKNFLRSSDFWWDHRFECQSDTASCQCKCCRIQYKIWHSYQSFTY